MNNKDDDSPDEYKQVEEVKTFEEALKHLINRHCQENISNTPDFILAQYMGSCLHSFNTAVQQRETWYGRDASPTTNEENTDEE